MVNSLAFLIPHLLAFPIWHGGCEESPRQVEYHLEKELSRPENWGPGFQYRVTGPVEIKEVGAMEYGADSEKKNRILKGDKFIFLVDGNVTKVVEELEPAELDNILGGAQGTEIALIVRRKKNKGSVKKSEMIDLFFRVKRTILKGDRYFPNFEVSMNGTATLLKSYDGSEASKHHEIKPGVKILAAGRDESTLKPIGGADAWKTAKNCLEGSSGSTFFISVEGGTKPIRLSHYRTPENHGEVEFLRPPPRETDRGGSIMPIIEDDKHCDIAAIKSLIKRVAEGIQKNEMVHRPLDDKLSEEFHERFLEDVDPDHLYFLKSDMLKFDQRRHAHDDDLRTGIPSYPFEVQASLLVRLEERVAWVDEFIVDAEPSKEWSYRIDRSKSLHPDSNEAARVLWKTKVNREVAKLVAYGASLEDARTRVKEKFHRMLARIANRCTGRILTGYLNAYAAVFGPFTRFYPPNESQRKSSDLSAQTCGMGVLVRGEDERLVIERVLHDSPAAGAGLKEGDEVMAIGRNGSALLTIDEFGAEKLVDKMGGECDTVVSVTIKRHGVKRPIQVSISLKKFPDEETRAVGKLFDYGKPSRKIGVISLPQFYGESAFGGSSVTSDVEALLAGELNGADAIIIDLRGNPGGYLREAVSLAGLFLGPKPVVQIVGKTSVKPEILKSNRVAAMYNGPVIVWTDLETASAAEIMAASIQDNGRGIVVGDPKTVGKAHLQRLRGVSDEAFNIDPFGGFKTTVEVYYPATGISRIRKGVEADIKFPLGTIPPTKLSEELERLPSPPDIPSVTNLVEKARLAQRLAKVQKAHADRMAADPELKKYEKALSDKNGADKITAEHFSLELFKREMALRKEWEVIRKNSIPVIPNDLPKKPYGRELLNIAVDWIEKK